MTTRRRFLETIACAIGVSAVPFSAMGATASKQGVGIRLYPPTGLQVLDGSIREGVFMDTGTGKPESGMFGNTRRYADGTPRFHEGIDIAPAPPWRRSEEPEDRVCAAAEGKVVYINDCTKNESLYGNYVVLWHQIPNFGGVYTLYGHLHHVDASLKIGEQIPARTVLGIMGHTPDIPRGRSHLHFEIGIMQNTFYPMIDEQHGVWNGANLFGIDPCVAFAGQRHKGCFDFADYLAKKPEAFCVAIDGKYLVNRVNGLRLTCSHMPYLRRHAPKTISAERPYAIAFSREGIPLSIRELPAEVKPGTILTENTAELRRGRQFVKHGELTQRGEALLEGLLVCPGFPPRSNQKQGEVG
jgi:murein DD-endopeptidase MepM/ murein hydrolase activator NlpD